MVSRYVFMEKYEKLSLNCRMGPDKHQIVLLITSSNFRNTSDCYKQYHESIVSLTSITWCRIYNCEHFENVKTRTGGV